MIAPIRLRLYVAGVSDRARRAVAQLHRLCQDCLGSGGYELSVVDVLAQPELAEADRILATPTVIRLSPLPQKRVIGDLADAERVIQALDLVRPAGPPPFAQERASP